MIDAQSSVRKTGFMNTCKKINQDSVYIYNINICDQII